MISLKKHALAIILISSLFMVLSCSTPKKVTKSKEESKFSSRDLLIDGKTEEKKDSVSAISTQETVEKMEEPVLIPDSVPEESQEKVVKEQDGYRIQVIATSSRNAAYSVKTALNKKFRDDVYIIIENPLYKVRIGDYDNYEEAKRLRFRLIRAGYKDSWVVKSKILKKF